MDLIIHNNDILIITHEPVYIGVYIKKVQLSISHIGTRLIPSLFGIFYCFDSDCL